MRQVTIWINSASIQPDKIELAKILAPIIAAKSTVHQDLLVDVGLNEVTIYLTGNPDYI